MTWTDVVREVQGVLDVFEGRPPRLDDIEIHQVLVDADGQAVRLRFDLGEFPEHPPAKWVEREANVVQVDLGLGNLAHLAITGVLAPAIGEITVAGVSGNIELTAVVGSFRVEAVGEMAWIRRLSAYKRGTSW
jgi:hypothetical protein